MTETREMAVLQPEQLRRVRSVWATAQPNALEVRAAYRRWSSSSPAGFAHRKASLWRWVAASFLFGGVALALIGRLQPFAPRNVSPGVESRVEPQHEGGPVGSVRPVEAVPAPVPALKLPRSSAAVPMTSMRPVGNQPSKDVTQGEREVGSWKKVAAAMRQGDSERTGRALDDLIRSGDPTTRDAARLTRAQLQIAQGDSAQARATLLQLADHGATALIRHRAKEMLLRLEQ